MYCFLGLTLFICASVADLLTNALLHWILAHWWTLFVFKLIFGLVPRQLSEELNFYYYNKALCPVQTLRYKEWGKCTFILYSKWLQYTLVVHKLCYVTGIRKCTFLHYIVPWQDTNYAKEKKNLKDILSIPDDFTSKNQTIALRKWKEELQTYWNPWKPIWVPCWAFLAAHTTVWKWDFQWDSLV